MNIFNRMYRHDNLIMGYVGPDVSSPIIDGYKECWSWICMNVNTRYDQVWTVVSVTPEPARPRRLRTRQT